jgi:hypothetical protein
MPDPTRRVNWFVVAPAPIVGLGGAMRYRAERVLGPYTVK